MTDDTTTDTPADPDWLRKAVAAINQRNAGLRHRILNLPDPDDDGDDAA